MYIREKIKNISLKKYYIPFVIFFIATLIINLKVGIEVGDDTVYRDTFNVYSTFETWAKDFYSMWGGRLIPIYLLIVFLTKRIAFWKVANSIVFLLLAIGIYLMCISKESKISDTRKLVIASFSCGIIFFIPIIVMQRGALWVTGSFNYIWPIAFCILALIPFKRLITGEKSKWYLMLISLVSAIYASNIEQTAAVLIVFSSLSIIYSFIKKIKVKLSYYIIWIISVVFSMFSLLAPGNSVRSSAEILRWYQDYDMLSLFDKIFLGCSITFNHVIKENMLLVSILGIIVCILVNKRNIDKVAKFISVLPIAYICTQVFQGAEELNFTREGLIIENSKKEYIRLFVAILIICILLYSIFCAFEDYRVGMVCLLFFAAALCASIVMGFSPTIYASGPRIFFVTDILLCLVVMMTLVEYIDKYIKKENMRTLFIGGVFIALILILRYI